MPRVIPPVLMFAALCFAQTTGSVEGVVVDRVTGAGIPGASVTFYIRTQGVLAEATTDASGEFRVFGMKPGSYEVRFEKEGYRFGNKIPPQPYIVGESPSPVRMRLEMTRMVSLSGRVIDPDGNPMLQGEVKLANRIAVPVAADGSFTITELEPGSYTIAAIPKPTRVPEGSRAPVTTYSPEPVIIRGDADLSGYEIRLQTAEVYRVSGVLLDEASSPKAGVTIRLFPSIQSGPRVLTFGDFITLVGPGPNIGPQEASVVSADDGSFEFPAVRSGDWQLAAVLTGSIESPNYADTIRSGAVGVVVGNRNVGNLQIRLGTSFKMPGTVDWGGVPSRRAVITLTPVDGRSAAVSRGVSDPNEKFTIEPVTPGKSFIVPQAGVGYYPVSVLLGGQEVLGKPVDLFPGSALHVTYKAATGSVHGTVENGDGATILLIPDNVQTMGFGRIVRCKADGSFDIAGVSPGDYFIAAFQQFQQIIPAESAPWLAKITSSGTRLSVAQTSVSVQLKANPWPE